MSLTYSRPIRSISGSTSNQTRDTVAFEFGSQRVEELSGGR